MFAHRSFSWWVKCNIAYIAVIENHDNKRFVGTLHETEVMSAYNRALVDARREEHDGHL